MTRFPLSKKVSVEHPLFIGQQYNEANNLFNINCHTRIRNGSCLFFAHFRLPSIKGQLNNIIIHSKYFPDSGWLKAHA